VSLRVQRTILKHESRVLLLLKGHPAIPVVYGYGRFKHFEYLAMEQLGSTLTNFTRARAACLLRQYC
jgi:predicted Ser/Thr protein kinase